LGGRREEKDYVGKRRRHGSMSGRDVGIGKRGRELDGGARMDTGREGEEERWLRVLDRKTGDKRE